MSAYRVSVEVTVISCKEIRCRGCHAQLSEIPVNKYYSDSLEQLSCFRRTLPINGFIYYKLYPRLRCFDHIHDIYLSARHSYIVRQIVDGQVSYTVKTNNLGVPIPEISSTNRRGRPYGKKPSRKNETFHSPDSSDVPNDSPASQVLPDQAFQQVKLTPVELLESSSSLLDDDSSDRRSPSSPMNQCDPDAMGEDFVSESSALTTSRSIALLHRLCDKLIGSMENTRSHVNEPNTDHHTIQEDTNHKDTRDPTNRTGMQDATHPINALNIQQLDLANIMKTELIQLEAVAR